MIYKEKWVNITDNLPKEVAELFILCRFSLYVQYNDLSKFNNTCLYFHLKIRSGGCPLMFIARGCISSETVAWSLWNSHFILNLSSYAA